jgi:hypothetical protein
MHTLTSKWGTWTLNQYLLARLLWAPYADVPGVLDEYFAQYYPTTTVETRRFYTELEGALVAITPLKATLARRLNTDQTPFPLDHMH